MMNEQPTGAPGPEQQPPDDQGGYCIEIYVGPGNQVMSVGVKPQPPEGFDAKGAGQDVQSIDEAVQVALEIYESNGQSAPEAEGQDMADAMEGYGRGGLRGMPVNKVLRDDR